MAWPTNSIAVTLEDLDRNLIRLKSQCNAWAVSLDTDTDAAEVINAYQRLRTERSALQAASGVPGLAAYTQAQKGDETLDVVAEFQAILAAIDSATSWISNAIPKDGSGYLLVSTLGPDTLIPRVFTPAETSVLKTRLLAIRDLIN